MKSLPNFGWFEGSCKTNEGTRNSTQTPRNNKNKIGEKHRMGQHMQRKNSLVNLGNEVSKRLGIFDMPSKVA
jgi:hypothetical protein